MIFFQKIWCDLIFPYFCTPKINAPIQKAAKEKIMKELRSFFGKFLGKKVIKDLSCGSI
jgi:hypothetical protein